MCPSVKMHSIFNIINMLFVQHGRLNYHFDPVQSIHHCKFLIQDYFYMMEMLIIVDYEPFGVP